MQSGYEIGREVREGYPVFDKNGKHITTIPYHHISCGVSRGIIKALSTGESSFRRYQP